MKKMGLIMLAVTVCLTFSVIPVRAEAEGVTQGELSQLLVKVLGLYRFLPANPSDRDCFTVLLANKIQPAAGWDAEAIVTKADLARLVVQSMERQHEVENPEDPMSWIKFLESYGVPLLRVNETVEYLEPLRRGVAPNVFRISPDPVEKRRIYAQPDEIEFGADAEFIATTPVNLSDVIEIFETIQPDPIEPAPVTPN